MKLTYSVEINVSKKKVWEKMINKKSYNDWAKAFSKDSQFEGKWKQGEIMNFVDAKQGGTKAVLEVCKPYEQILAKHVEIIMPDGSADTKSEAAKKWIGSTEHYVFEGKEITTLQIIIQTDEVFKPMFDESWPKALQLLKELCESS